MPSCIKMEVVLFDNIQSSKGLAEQQLQELVSTLLL